MSLQQCHTHSMAARAQGLRPCLASLAMKKKQLYAIGPCKICQHILACIESLMSQKAGSCNCFCPSIETRSFGPEIL